jgi:hypothetical protein
LNASLLQTQGRCSEEEFSRYRRAVGAILGEILLEVMNPLYARHPNLKPAELK